MLIRLFSFFFPRKLAHFLKTHGFSHWAPNLGRFVFARRLPENITYLFIDSLLAKTDNAFELLKKTPINLVISGGRPKPKDLTSRLPPTLTGQVSKNFQTNTRSHSRHSQQMAGRSPKGFRYGSIKPELGASKHFLPKPNTKQNQGVNLRGAFRWFLLGCLFDPFWASMTCFGSVSIIRSSSSSWPMAPDSSEAVTSTNHACRLAASSSDDGQRSAGRARG